MLDNIHWFPSINTTPVCNRDFRPSGFSFDSYNSNNICLEKRFDYGNKYNIVKAKIERTKSFDELIDISDIVKMLSDSLGKPIGQHMSCCFDDDEYQAKLDADHEFNRIREQLNNDDFFEEFDIPIPMTVEEISKRVEEELQLPKSVSRKKQFFNKGRSMVTNTKSILQDNISRKKQMSITIYSR